MKTTKSLIVFFLIISSLQLFSQKENVKINTQNEETNKTRKLKPGVLLGGSASTTWFSQPTTGYHHSYNFLTNDKLHSSISPLLGLSLDYCPNADKRFSFYADLLYNSQYYKGEFTDYRTEDSKLIYYYDFGISSVRISAMFKYTFFDAVVSPYLGVGFFISQTVSDKNDLTIEKYSSDEVTTEDYDVLIDWDNTPLFGFNGELGIKYKFLQLGFRFDASNLGKMTYLTNGYQTYSLFVGFTFTGNK